MGLLKRHLVATIAVAVQIAALAALGTWLALSKEGVQVTSTLVETPDRGGTNGKAAVVEIRVPIEGPIDRLPSKRAILELSFANARALEAAGATVRVFLAERRLTATTPSSEPSFVTLLTFFGAGSQPSTDARAERRMSVDLTRALRRNPANASGGTASIGLVFESGERSFGANVPTAQTVKGHIRLE